MRILHVTDLHGNMDWYRWLAGQADSHSYALICISGDLIENLGRLSVRRQMDEIKSALISIRTPMAICGGNHDFVRVDDDLRAWISDLKREHVWVDGEQFELNGERFYCHPWDTPLPEAKVDEIWIIHSPPEGVEVAVSEYHGDCGDFEFAEACRSGYGPRFAMCGHVHTPPVWHSQLGGTVAFNPGFAEKSPVPAYIVYDLKARTATWHWPGKAPIQHTLPLRTAERLLRGASREKLERLLEHAIRNSEIEGMKLTPEEIENCRKRLRQIADDNDQT